MWCGNRFSCQAFACHLDLGNRVSPSKTSSRIAAWGIGQMRGVNCLHAETLALS